MFIAELFAQLQRNRPGFGRNASNKFELRVTVFDVKTPQMHGAVITDRQQMTLAHNVPSASAAAIHKMTDC